MDLSALDADQRSTLRVARESGKALQEIVDGLLDFSKIEANSLELNPVPSSIHAVVDSVARLHTPVAARRNIALRSIRVATRSAPCCGSTLSGWGRSCTTS